MTPTAFTRVDHTGRNQRRQSASARARRPALERYYGRRLPDITPGDFEFSLDIPGRPPVSLDPFVVSFEWTEDDASVSANVQLTRPTPEDTASIPLQRGTLIRCRAKWAGHWYEVWTMRCERPEVTVETGSISVDLLDDLAVVRRGRRHYVFRRTRRRRHGWFGHDALREAAKRDGIKLGSIAKCSKRVDKIDLWGSFLDLATHVYTHERDASGRKFILRMRNGRFEVVPYARNKLLYVLAEQIRSAVIARTPKVENPITVLTGKGRLGTGHKAKRIQHTEFNREVVDRLGYAHHVKDYGRVSSSAALRRAVQRDLARQLRVDTTATIQFPGIPFIRRGDGAQVVIPTEGFKDAKSFVFTTGMRHQVQAGTYTTEADVNFHDPFTADKDRRERELRAEKRKGREGSLDGKTVGASVFTDAVGYHGDRLAGRMAFAELGNGHNLGTLPYRAQLDIEYNGKIVRAIKLDIGLGGDSVKGYRRDIDLHSDLASALGFPADGVDTVQIKAVS